MTYTAFCSSLQSRELSWIDSHRKPLSVKMITTFILYKQGIIYTIFSHLHVLYGDLSTNAHYILASREIQQLYSGATYGHIYYFVVELVTINKTIGMI